MAAAPTRRGLVGFFKHHWNENPEILGSGVQGLVGLFMGLYVLKVYYDNDGDNRRYRNVYTVYRHDDPRVPKLKTHCDVTSKP
ncbi:hypothetical protein ABEB36_002923 [Hypothenemus hampei]|uniref:Uncharacterized protein n=1 Tax=Hypothenemus hampei TaxID=57062 RepID=A0ABD1F7G8_HYPHA